MNTPTIAVAPVSSDVLSHRGWMAYVPRYVVDDLIAHGGEIVVGREQRWQAVVLFADIGGFTAMSERLGQIGREGSETLTSLLNAYFGPMINLIETYGGIVSKFSGDGLTALFPYDMSTQPTTIAQTIACSVDMQAEMPRYANMPTRAGSFTLTIGIGLAMGDMMTAIVGDPSLRLEYLVIGQALDRAVRAEQYADHGAIVIHRDLLVAAPIEYAVLNQSDDVLAEQYVRITRLLQPVGHNPLPPLPDVLPMAVRGRLEAFLHAAIALRLSKAQQALISEHRKVTVLFVQFRDFDYERDPHALERLQAYVMEIFWLIGRYDGYVRQIDMGDKGSKYIVVFGAPVTHENDVERALHCALELRQVQHIPTCIGMTTGFVYCGMIGSSTRQEYTLVGDTVNLAARLMQAADAGQILVSQTTRQESPAGFRWQAHLPLRVKGKIAPVPVALLSGTEQQHRSRLHTMIANGPLVGRQTEMKQATRYIQQVLAGTGQILGLTGDAGIGKSRLAAEIMHMGESCGMQVASGTCYSYAMTSGYVVWQEVLRDLTGLDAAGSREDQEQYLRQQVSVLGEGGQQRLPLLNALFHLNIADSERTRNLDPRLRKASLESLVTDWLCQRALSAPLILVLEDCQWIDPLSHDLLETVARHMQHQPILLIVIYRSGGGTAGRLRIANQAHFVEMSLHELHRTESIRLIQLKLMHVAQAQHANPQLQALAFGSQNNHHVPRHQHRGAVSTPDLSDACIEQICDRSQGNPLYIDAILNLLHNPELDLTDPDVIVQMDLPDSLHSLIMSRIDQLPEGPKMTLKVASVVGQRFYADWLWQIYPQMGLPATVSEHLSYLAALELIVERSTQTGSEYHFKHILTREVAYSSLSAATRTMLHEQIGQLIERIYADHLDAWLDFLAYHYSQSQHSVKQKRYIRRAAAVAQQQYNHESAIDYYQRLLPLLPPAEQADVLLELGSIWQLIGTWDQAETAYQQALGLAISLNDRLVQARCDTAMGLLFYLRGLYVDALIWLEYGRESLAELGDADGLCQTLRLIGNVYLQQSQYEQALALYEQSHEIAMAIQNQREASQSLANMGRIYSRRSDYQRALDCYEQWLYLAIDLNDQQQTGMMLGELGHVYWLMGNPVGAHFCYAQQMRIATEIGDRRMLSAAWSNLAEIYAHQGDLAACVICLDRCLHIAIELGDRLGMVVGMGYMAAVYTLQQHYDEADACFERAIYLGRLINTISLVCDFLCLQAFLYWRQQRYQEGQLIAAEACTLGRLVQRDDLLIHAEVMVLYLDLALERIDRATATTKLQQKLETCTETTDRAMLHHTIWSFDREREDHRQHAIQLYRQVPAISLRIGHRHRYRELTGEDLPTAALPPLPEMASHQASNLQVLLNLVDQVIAAL
ncbi:MAG: tetratricopeptide repeat protein [Chloroflexaceae bacterium]|nr:tetratricopeptide repeat protein [Chloroflexaceae bacterium]